jgi:hypothetical protein
MRRPGKRTSILAAAALAATAIAVLALRAGTGRPAWVPRSMAELEARRASLSRPELVSALAGLGTREAYDELVKSYGSWAAQDRACPGCAEILRALGSHADPRQRVRLVFAAITADPRSAEEDPHWRPAAEALAASLEAPAIRREARNALLTVRGAKARRFLVVALATHAGAGAIAEAEQLAIAGDLGDLYFAAADDPGLRREIGAALTAMKRPELAAALEGTLRPEQVPATAARLDAMQQEVARAGTDSRLPPR